MRIQPQTYQQLPLYVHTFLADIPLHDVWAIPLPNGRPDLTIRHVLTFLQSAETRQVNPIVRALFGLRWWLGRLFGWDEANQKAIAPSYIDRLPPADRARSLDEPGRQNGIFRVVYTFENESLGEIINGTVHAFSLLTLQPAEKGHTLYWAIYVKKVNRLTPFYMALIDPFRHLFVYPAVTKNIQRHLDRPALPHEPPAPHPT
jgi:hypothetical protein